MWTSRTSFWPCNRHFLPTFPAASFIKPGTTNMLIVDPIRASLVRQPSVTWPCPTIRTTTGDLSIPLLPAWIQPVLIKNLERHIERFSQSDEGPQKYDMVTKEYEDLLEKAALYRDFADGKVEDLRVRTHVIRRS